MPCWIDSSQPDPDAAAAFYGGLFGWEFENRDAGRRAEASTSSRRLRGGDVGGDRLAARGRRRPAAWNTYVWVDSADETAAKVARRRRQRADGAVRRLRRRTDGRVRRPAEGAAFCVWQARAAPRRADRQRARLAELQRPLHARPRAARRRSTARSSAGRRLDSSAAAPRSWALPAYGDYLEERDPGLRERMKDVGAPDRFEDVGRVPRPRRGRATPPHWSVTFGVDDADAAAERAAELGGEVIVPPFDAPWVR